MGAAGRPTMVEELDKLKEFTILGEQMTILSSLNDATYQELEELADTIVESMK